MIRTAGHAGKGSQPCLPDHLSADWLSDRPPWLLAGKAGPNEGPLTPEQRQRYAQMQVEAQRRLQDGQQKLLLTQKAMQVLSQNGQLVRTRSVPSLGHVCMSQAPVQAQQDHTLWLALLNVMPCCLLSSSAEDGHMCVAVLIGVCCSRSCLAVQCCLLP